MNLSDAPESVIAKIRKARVARLATVDTKGHPHLVPICYVYDGTTFLTAVDAKPKKVKARQLKRVRNIAVNPRVTILVDQYNDDWNELWYVMIHGEARILRESPQKSAAIRLLREKYEPYREGLLQEDSLVIQIRPVRSNWWGNI